MRTFQKCVMGLCAVLTQFAASPAMACCRASAWTKGRTWPISPRWPAQRRQAAARAGARSDHAMAEEFTLHYLKVQVDFVEQVDETWRCIAR